MTVAPNAAPDLAGHGPAKMQASTSVEAASRQPASAATNGTNGKVSQSMTVERAATPEGPEDNEEHPQPSRLLFDYDLFLRLCSKKGSKIFRGIDFMLAMFDEHVVTSSFQLSVVESSKRDRKLARCPAL